MKSNSGTKYNPFNFLVGIPLCTIGYFTNSKITIALGVIGILEFVASICKQYTNKNFDRMFFNLELYDKEGNLPTLKKIEKTSYSDNYHFTIPQGKTFDDIQKLEKKLEVCCNAKVDLQQLNKTTFVLRIVKEILRDAYAIIPESQIIKTQEYKYQYSYPEDVFPKPLNTYALGLFMGLKSLEIAKIDLQNMCNILIEGCVNSGKTMCAIVLMVQMILKDCIIIIYDKKRGADYSFLKKYNRCLMANEIDDMTQLIRIVKAEVNRRNELFAKYECRNHKSYYKKTHKKVPPVYVVIEEYAQLKVKEGKILETEIETLAALARSTNIYVMIITQHASTKIVNTSFKNNLQNRVVFQMETTSASGVALNNRSDKRAYYLNQTGRGYFKTGGKKWQLFQGFFFPNEEDVDVILKDKLTGKWKSLEDLPENFTLDQIDNIHEDQFVDSSTEEPDINNYTGEESNHLTTYINSEQPIFYDEDEIISVDYDEITEDLENSEIDWKETMNQVKGITPLNKLKPVNKEEQ